MIDKIRTLLRVTEVHRFGLEELFDVIKAEVIAWPGENPITIYLEDMPEFLYKFLEVGLFFHAHSNLGAEKEEDLDLSDYEHDGRTAAEQLKAIDKFWDEIEERNAKKED